MKDKEVKEIKFEESVDLDQIGSKLLTIAGLSKAKVKFLFVSGRNIRYSGKLSKTTSLMKFLTGLDFIVLVNKDVWVQFNQNQKEALILHELLHVAYDENKNRFVTREHDVEEFVEVVERYGPWMSVLKLMEEAFQKRESK